MLRRLMCVGLLFGVMSGSCNALAHAVPARTEALEVNWPVRIMVQGDAWRLMIPNDALFVAHTPRLSRQGKQLLQDTADYLRQLPTTTMTVSAFTDNAGAAERRMILSRQRARIVANYLWRQHLDTRLLVAKGRGAAAPIASNQTAEGRIKNQRVDITFRTRTTPSVD